MLIFAEDAAISPLISFNFWMTISSVIAVVAGVGVLVTAAFRWKALISEMSKTNAARIFPAGLSFLAMMGALASFVIGSGLGMVSTSMAICFVSYLVFFLMGDGPASRKETVYLVIIPFLTLLFLILNTAELLMTRQSRLVDLLDRFIDLGLQL